MKLLAIDGNSILYRSFFGIRLLANKQGFYTNAIVGFLNTLLKLERVFEPKQTIITFDQKGKTFRHELYESYKGTRKSMPSELVQQIGPLKEILKSLGYPLLEQAGYEADDILGTLADQCHKKQIPCVIATGDQDALQLLMDDVQVYLIKTKENKLYHTKEFVQEYGISPSSLVDLKGLMGDRSDNIPGIAGIGEKFAFKILKQVPDLDALYQHFQDIKMSIRVKNLLEQGKEQAYLSRELATICKQVPLEQPVEQLVRKSIDQHALATLLTELELFRFFELFGLKKGLQIEHSQGLSVVAKEIEVLYNPSKDTLEKQLKACETLDIVWDEQRLFFCMADQVIVIDQQVQMVLKNYVLQSNKPKRTIQSKRLYHESYQQNQPLNHLDFDVQLAAYLLDPISQEYALEELVGRYLPYHYHYALPQPWGQDQQVATVAAFSDLCNVLETQLKQQEMEKLYREIELPLCEVLAEMEYTGLLVDKEKIRNYGEVLKFRMKILGKEMFELAGEPFNPSSSQGVAVILFQKLGLPGGKKLKKGYSTKANVLEGLRKKHPIIDLILEYRKLKKLYTTYVVGLMEHIGHDERIHSTFHQTKTKTGRITSTEPNMQNIPIRTEEGRQMRQFFIVPAGYQLVDADYSQIELRILAHMAHDDKMIQAFAQGDDIHRITASQVFGVELEQVTNTLRSRAKAINFGIVYGIGAFSLSQDIHTSVAKAQNYIEAYLNTYSGVRGYMEQVIEQAKKQEYVSTLYGRRRDMAEINSSNKLVQSSAKRIALNTPIQGTAADLIKIAMIRVHRRLRKENLDAKIVLQVHDELLLEVGEEDVQRVALLVREEMENSAKLKVDLIADVHNGYDWDKAKG